MRTILGGDHRVLGLRMIGARVETAIEVTVDEHVDRSAVGALGVPELEATRALLFRVDAAPRALFGREGHAHHAVELRLGLPDVNAQDVPVAIVRRDVEIGGAVARPGLDR